MDKDRKALEELLGALELDRRIREGAVKLPEPKPMELLLEEAKKNGRLVTRGGKVDGRALAGKARRKKNQQRKKKAAKQQRWRRSWQKRSLSKALEGNHYPYYNKRWKEKKRGFTFSEEEWNQWVQPAIPSGAVIELRRYDTSLPTSLDNLIVYNGSDGSVLFDGKDWKLKQLGAIL